MWRGRIAVSRLAPSPLLTGSTVGRRHPGECAHCPPRLLDGVPTSCSALLASCERHCLETDSQHCTNAWEHATDGPRSLHRVRCAATRPLSAAQAKAIWTQDPSAPARIQAGCRPPRCSIAPSHRSFTLAPHRAAQRSPQPVRSCRPRPLHRPSPPLSGFTSLRCRPAIAVRASRRRRLIATRPSRATYPRGSRGSQNRCRYDAVTVSSQM